VKNKWYRSVLYNIACLFLAFLRCLPRPVVLCLGRGGSRCAFYFIRREREKALANLKKAFGETMTDKELWNLGIKVFENMALTACDFVLFPQFDADALARLVIDNEIEKLGTVDERRKQGGIIITAHMGNWELLAATVIAHGYNGIVLGKKLRHDGYNDLIIQLRESQKVYTYYRDQSPKVLLQRLKNGVMVGILPDQDIADVKGIFIDFFGIPAYTPTGPVKLAITAKVPIIMAFMIRDGKKYRFVIDRIIDTQIKSDESKDDAVVRITTEWSGVIEEYIKKYPEQWAWVHNRWKTQKNDVK